MAAARLTDYERGLKTDVDTTGTIYKYLDDGEKQRIQEYQLISVVGTKTFFYLFLCLRRLCTLFFHHLNIKIHTSHILLIHFLLIILPCSNLDPQILLKGFFNRYLILK